jgi:uncharacterized protein YndB with AHSA1/START domain
MSQPTKAERTVTIDAPPETVYDLVADVTRMGEWSPECTACEWLGDPGRVGSRFRGHNRRGPVRWTTTAEVVAAERPNTFAFATMNGDAIGTRWTYTLRATDRGTELSEGFESVSTPRLIALAERLFIRNRQQQLEAGIDDTLAAVKAAAEASHDPR